MEEQPDNGTITQPPLTDFETSEVSLSPQDVDVVKENVIVTSSGQIIPAADVLEIVHEDQEKYIPDYIQNYVSQTIQENTVNLQGVLKEEMDVIARNNSEAVINEACEGL